MKFRRAVVVFALCMCAAFVCALVFAVLAVSNLPPTDWAYHESMAQRLSDPFVYNGIILGGIVFGIVSFPFVYFATRNRRLQAAAPAIFAIVVGEIVVVTPILRIANLPFAVVALVVALLLCRAGVFGK